MIEILNAVNDVLENTITGLPFLYISNITNVKPPLLTPWMRTTIIPSEPIQISTGYFRELQNTGLIQLDYFYPAGQGPEDSSNNLKTIVDWFNNKDNRNLVNAGVQILIESAWRSTDSQDTTWNAARIFIRYLTFT